MLCMLHRHVGLSRPLYVNKIYSFIHSYSIFLLEIHTFNHYNITDVFIFVCHSLYTYLKSHNKVLGFHIYTNHAWCKTGCKLV